MMLKTCTFSYAEVNTVQVPVLRFSRHGSSVVQYEPMRFVSYNVTFPSVDAGTQHTHYVMMPFIPNTTVVYR